MAGLGPDHPNTLRSMHNLANIYAAFAAPRSAACGGDAQADEGQARPDHPDTLMGMHNLANSYDDLGRHPEALAYTRRRSSCANPSSAPTTLRRSRP